MAVDAYLAALDTLHGRIFRFEEEIARTTMETPGPADHDHSKVGHVTAVTILAKIVDHTRFAVTNTSRSAY